MRRFAIAFVTAVSMISLTQIASAAPYNWTGFYVGGNVGYGWGTAKNNLSILQSVGGLSNFSLGATDANNVDGVIGGALAGYNWQFSNVLFGVEADIQASGQKGTTAYGATLLSPFGASSNNPATVTDINKLAWVGTVRGRLGITRDRWLMYATGGMAFGNVNISGSAQPINSNVADVPLVWNQSATKVGWIIGAGVENALSANWRWRIEYLYMDFGNVTAAVSGGAGNCYGGPSGGVGLGGCTFTNGQASGSVTSKFTDSIIRAGVSYNF